MPCFLCNHNITPSETCGSLEFAGDAFAERGRYAVHRECLRPEWKKRFVTRDNLLHPEMMSPVAPKMDSEQYLWWHEAKKIPPSPLRRALASFFAWGSRQCAIEPLPSASQAPPVSHQARRFSLLGKLFLRQGGGGVSHTSLQHQESQHCTTVGCEQSPGATGYCTQHQWRASLVAEPADELPLPLASLLSRLEAMEAMHKHARCCAYESHFSCAEFICLGRQYICQGGTPDEFLHDWGECWNPHEATQVQSEQFFVVRSDEEA